MKYLGWTACCAVVLLSCADDQAATLTQVSPPIGPEAGGTAVVIKGENLQAGSEVFFGSTPAVSVSWVDGSTINAVSPPGIAGAVDVTVREADGDEASVDDGFTYLAEPLVDQACQTVVSPAFGAVDVDVTTGFTVTFNREVDPSALEAAFSLRRVDSLVSDEGVPFSVEVLGPQEARVTPTNSLAFFADYAITVDSLLISGSELSCPAAGGVISTRRLAPEDRSLRAAPINGFAVVGTTGIAVSRGYRGLQIYDLVDAENPALIGAVETEAMPVGIVVHGTRAYVPAGRDGVLIFDVADPQNPQLQGVAGTPGVAQEVVAFDFESRQLLAVADGPAGLRIIDASEPEGAFDLAWLHPSGQPATYVSGVAKEGDLLAVAQQDQGFAIVDVAVPTAPVVRISRLSEVQVETFSKSLSVTDVSLDQGKLFVALGPHGFQGFDLSDPAAPVFEDFAYGPEGHCPAYCTDLNMGIVANGGQLFATSLITGIVSLDFGGGQFGALRTLPLTGRTLGLTLAGQRLYGATERGLAVFDRGAPDGSAPIYAEAEGTGLTRSLALSGGHLYVAAGSRGLETYSLANPEQPQLVNVVATTGVQADDGTTDVAVSGSHLLLADGRLRLEVFDLTDPAAPVSKGVVAGNDSVNAIEMRQDRAFVCNGNAAMMVVDYLATPPARSGEISLNQDVSGCIGLKAVGDHLYVAGGRALGVLDISNPDQPTLVRTLELPADEAVTALESYGDLLYASTAIKDYEGTYGVAQRLWAFDISDRSLPVRIFKSEDLGASGRMSRQGDKLFMPASFAGAWVFGLSEPSAPELEGQIMLPGLASRAAPAAASQLVYFAQGGGGLGIVRTGALPTD